MGRTRAGSSAQGLSVRSVAAGAVVLVAALGVAWFWPEEGAARDAVLDDAAASAAALPVSRREAVETRPRASVSVERPTASGDAIAPLAPESAPAVPLRPRSKWRFLLLRDERGTPLPGATVYDLVDEGGVATDAFDGTTLTSDEDGALRVPRVGRVRPLRIVVPGHLPAKHALRPQAPDSEVVVLTRTTRMDVTAGVPAWSNGMRLSVSGRWSERLRPDPLLVSAGAATPQWSSDPDPAGVMTASYRLPTDLGLRIEQLPAGVAWTVRLIGPYDAVLAERAVTLAEGEWVTLDLEVEREPATVRGVVRRERDGAPLRGAQVRVRRPGEEALTVHSETTDVEGAFEFSGVYADRLELGAVKAHRGAWRGEVVVERPETVLDLTLVSSRLFLLRVREQGSGRPFRNIEGTADPRVLRIEGKRREAHAGVLEFAGLPEAAVDITVRAAGRRFHTVRPAGQWVGELEVPESGRVSVVVGQFDGHEGMLDVEVRARGVPADVLRGSLMPGNGRAFVLFEGRYEVRVTPKGKAAPLLASELIDVAGGGTLELAFGAE